MEDNTLGFLFLIFFFATRKSKFVTNIGGFFHSPDMNKLLASLTGFWIPLLDLSWGKTLLICTNVRGPNLFTTTEGKMMP